YGRYRHGEAVGLGLLAALRLSGLPELRDAVARLLVARGLPTKLDDGIDPEQVIVCAQRDKKRAGGPGTDGARAVGYVLLDAPGKPRIGCTIAADELRAAVTELLA
ncbi:MAG TPA: 3-dehydroquinate synthase, partial [Solirubrobacteraceae bacterium]|nr:3-dehydroquinate synthase [Solirubrobacteraceae bacterium]